MQVRFAICSKYVVSNFKDPKKIITHLRVCSLKIQGKEWEKQNPFGLDQETKLYPAAKMHKYAYVPSKCFF